jgi:hypothetical protein
MKWPADSNSFCCQQAAESASDNFEPGVCLKFGVIPEKDIVAALNRIWVSAREAAYLQGLGGVSKAISFHTGEILQEEPG